MKTNAFYYRIPRWRQAQKRKTTTEGCTTLPGRPECHGTCKVGVSLRYRRRGGRMEHQARGVKVGGPPSRRRSCPSARFVSLIYSQYRVGVRGDGTSRRERSAEP